MGIKDSQPIIVELDQPGHVVYGHFLMPVESEQEADRICNLIKEWLDRDHPEVQFQLTAATATPVLFGSKKDGEVN